MSTVFYPLGCSDTDMSDGEYSALQDARWEYPEHLDTEEGSWQSKDAGLLKIAEMTDQHIDNAIKWMKTCGFDRHPKFKELRRERQRRQRKVR